MNICSLLPGATEILYALGLGEEVVAVSHECDYPSDALKKPRVIRTILDQNRDSSLAIDAAVRASVAKRQSLYEVDETLLRELKPDLIVTQSLCEVCAIDTAGIQQILRALTPPPRVISLHPHTLEALFNEIRMLGHVTNRNAEAGRLVSACVARIERVQSLVAQAPRPRVFCLEWLEPPMVSGHWVPEQVALAGGQEVLGQPGVPSRYAIWEEVVAARPNVLILMPCGFSIERTRKEISLLTAQPWWSDLPAVREGRVYLVDGPAYFNRSGPRLIDGIELLAGLLHPDVCGPMIPAGSMEPLALNAR